VKERATPNAASGSKGGVSDEVWSEDSFKIVMAGLVPAIHKHDWQLGNMDGRHGCLVRTDTRRVFGDMADTSN
jgi:hypothetical protein